MQTNLSLSQMADQKASILMGATFVVFTIAVGQVSRGDMPVSSGQAMQAFRDAGYALLAVKPEHAVRVEELPAIHGDPFDRLLIAQARFEPMTLLTSDRLVGQYGAGIVLL